MRPSFNTSHIPYPEMGAHDSGPSTQVVQDPPEGDDDQGQGRRHRTVRHPRCGTGGYRHHH
ncbi:hypothetical protein F511_16516 [Dorcoceras hygrometricum]|uniref:Uncharacterized protein n=1 Tax=Dorcoceras hygrometricum TaxID=472368 RepID=A0A2Z7BDA6_9LAMI|nr:hypothetical protein F511_16516 [Dorcoceras hygrometricum]